MKIWKKLMVIGVAIVLVSAIFATQYMSIQSNATLTIDTQSADLQIAAKDPAIGNQSAHALLTDTGSGYEMDLGTWGTQNNITSTEAMLLVNAGASEIKITGCTLDSDIADDINVYLHDGAMTPDTFESGTYKKAWSAASQSSTLTSDNAVHLAANDTEAYDGNGNLTIMEDKGNSYGNAEWGSSGSQGGQQWYYNYTDPQGGTSINGDFVWASTDMADPSTNAVWVYICLNGATLDETAGTGTLSFDVESA